MNEVGKLGKYKRDHKLSYDELAQEMRIPVRTLFRWMKGESEPRRMGRMVIQDFLEKEGR